MSRQCMVDGDSDNNDKAVSLLSDIETRGEDKWMDEWMDG